MELRGKIRLANISSRKTDFSLTDSKKLVLNF